MSNEPSSNWQKQRTNAHAWKRQSEDWYPEPPLATEALIKVERVVGSCWDPACGMGNIVDVLSKDGQHVWGTDMVDRGYPFMMAKREFLSIDPNQPGERHPDILITNPPFQLAQRFVDHALKFATWKVIVLARLAFLESDARSAWFQRTPLARVWVFPWRLSMPPGGVATKATGGKTAFAWFVWEKGWRGPPQIGWLQRP